MTNKNQDYKKPLVSTPKKHEVSPPHKQTREKQTQFNDSITGVYPIRTHGVGCWGNRRVVMSIRVDEKLKNEATKVLKAIYGSTCRGIETYLAGLVATYEQQAVSGVYPSHTVEIGKLVIERNVCTRRKLVVEETNEEVVEKVVAKPKPEREPVDYSKLSLEELQALYDKYTRWGPQKYLGPYSMVMGELKKRGITP